MLFGDRMRESKQKEEENYSPAIMVIITRSFKLNMANYHIEQLHIVSFFPTRLNSLEYSSYTNVRSCRHTCISTHIAYHTPITNQSGVHHLSTPKPKQHGDLYVEQKSQTDLRPEGAFRIVDFQDVFPLIQKTNHTQN